MDGYEMERVDGVGELEREVCWRTAGRLSDEPLSEPAERHARRAGSVDAAQVAEAIWESCDREV